MFIFQTCNTDVLLVHSKKSSQPVLDIARGEPFFGEVDVQMLTSANRFIEGKLLYNEMRRLRTNSSSDALRFPGDVR